MRDTRKPSIQKLWEFILTTIQVCFPDEDPLNDFDALSQLRVLSKKTDIVNEHHPGND